MFTMIKREALSDHCALTVILLVPDHFDTVRTTVAHLQEQTVKEQIELLVVAPAAKEIELDEKALSTFGAWDLVEVEDMTSSGPARAEAIQRAHAPLVVFAEDHSYPDPTWAEAFIAAHREHEVAAVGPELSNANPRTLVSWTDFFMNFGFYTGHEKRTNLGHVAWHSSAYRRDLLLEFGSALDKLLEVEGLLQAKLREKGYKMMIDPAAHTRHYNMSRWGAFIVEQFVNGRQFGATRAEAWSGWRRLLYVGAGPLIPFVRMRQVIRELRRTGRSGPLLPQMLPVLAAGAVVNGLGEMVGYALGAGRANEQKFDMEFHRERFMIEEDRRELEAERDQGRLANPEDARPESVQKPTI